jgi:hypothetical protein
MAVVKYSGAMLVALNVELINANVDLSKAEIGTQGTLLFFSRQFSNKNWSAMVTKILPLFR